MLAVKTAIGPTILIQSGTYFDLLDPAGSQWTIEDIAHGLSLTCRFAGQCRDFYSVAEHCWHASFLVPPRFALEALLHDASEAFLGDVTRPLKSLLPEYKRIEKGVEAAIAARFGLPATMSPEVKRADLALLAAEQAQIMPPHADDWACLAGLQPAEINIRLWSPQEARFHFLNRFAALSRSHWEG